MEFLLAFLPLWVLCAIFVQVALTAVEDAPLTWQVLVPWPYLAGYYAAGHRGEGLFSKFPWSRKSKRWQSKRISLDIIKAGVTMINGLTVTHLWVGEQTLLAHLNNSHEVLRLKHKHGYFKKKELEMVWSDWVRAERRIHPQTFNTQQPQLPLMSEGVRVTPPKPEKEVEGAVRLWRIWRHRGGVLYPLTNTKAWCPGENRCDQYPGRSSNSAGFYGFFDLREIKQQEHAAMEAARTGRAEDDCNSVGSYTFVIGSFLGYGRILEGTLGCRVEYAMPEYLILPDRNDDYAIELMTLADKHGMRPITVEQALTLTAGLVPWVKKGVRND